MNYATGLSSIAWRKSSYSGQNGGNCLEGGDDLINAAAWRRSSYSNQNGGNCLEVADDFAEAVVPVRDSKNPHGPALLFPSGAWNAFVSGIKRR